MQTGLSLPSLAIGILMLGGSCATPPARIAETPSGRPEVTISAVDLDKVGNEIVNEMQNVGYLLEDQSSNVLFFTREMEGGQAVAAQLLIGNSYSTTPKAEVRFTLSKGASVVRVVAHASMSTQMAFGQTNRQDMKGNNYWFNDIQGLLMRIKSRLEPTPDPAIPAEPAAATDAASPRR